MELQDSVLKSFAEAVNKYNGRDKDVQTVYAKVVRKTEDSSGNTIVYVQLNGAADGVETPATTLVEVGVNDIVMVSIKNHNAVITGNISYPSLTRAGSFYITLTADGLQIGRVDENGDPVGTYMLVSDNSTSIYDEEGTLLATFGLASQIGKTSLPHLIFTSTGIAICNGAASQNDVIALAEFNASGITLRDSSGNTVATFTNSEIMIGASSSASIKFCNGKAIISLDSDTLKISGGNNVGAIGISNSYGNYKSEVVCEANSSNKQFGIQLLYNNNRVTSIIGSYDGVNVSTPQGKHLYENGVEVVKVDDIVTFGSVVINISAGNASRFWCWCTPSIPSGYTLVGLSRIETNYESIWDLSYYYANYSDGKITVGFVTKDGSSQPKAGQVYLVWFAIRTTAAKYAGSETIDF